MLPLIENQDFDKFEWDVEPAFTRGGQDIFTSKFRSSAAKL